MDVHTDSASDSARRGIGALVEPTPRPRVGLQQLRRDLGRNEVVNGVTAAIFSMTGPTAVIVVAAAQAKLSPELLSSWIFGAFALGGLLTILASWLYRQPLAFFWTIPGTVVVGNAALTLPWSDILGAYILTAILITALGLTGRMDKVMAALPMPIVMAMVAGVFVSFGTGLVNAVGSSWPIAAPMVLAFVLAIAVPQIGRIVPPLIGAVIVGIVAVIVTGDHGEVARSGSVLAVPVLQAPSFSMAAAAELVLPLAITVLFVQNGQGMAVLTAAGHRPPMRFATLICGLWSFPGAAIGAVTTCLTGPTNALLTASGRRERQYAAGIVCGLIAIGFGVLAPLTVSGLTAMPPTFIAVLAGLALFKALSGAFSTAFSATPIAAPLITFLVTASELSVFNLGAPFWGLVCGLIAHWLVRRNQPS